MSTLLQLDASASPGGSVSRRLTAAFAAAWQAGRPVSAVIHRDLGLHPPAALDRALLGALWAKPDEAGGPGEPTPEIRAARGASDTMVQEFLAADAFVMGVPMYNFSVPAGFKAWIDHVVRFGRTVVRGPRGTEPVREGRKALIFATRAGDFSKGGARDGWDFVGPYLEKVLPYAGVEPEIIPVVTGRGDEPARIAEAESRLRETLARWSAAAEEAAAWGTGPGAGGKEAA